MADPGHAIEVLRELHGMGLRITVDDFGTGYSSLPTSSACRSMRIRLTGLSYATFPRTLTM